MFDANLPLPYRWFLARGLTDWCPWYFVDGDVPTSSAGLEATCRSETGADFDVRLFARRQDRDDFAFFVVRNGRIEDKVLDVHLTFSNRREHASPLRAEDVTTTFMEWMRDTVLADVADWMSEADLFDQ